MPFRPLKKAKFIFSSAFPNVLEVHTSTPSKTRSFCANFALNPRAKISAGAHRFCNENAFWHILGPDLVDVFNDASSTGRLSVSQRTAFITLIFKKGDRLDMNWRPISLLTCDYKLCARVLAGRLFHVLQSIIGLDQTCGVPGPLIGDSVAFS